MSTPPNIRLVAGLGNPGREYARTRHNVGFDVLDKLADALGARFSLEKKWKTEVAKAGDLVLLKPQTYMNLSGEAIRSAASFYRIPPVSTLVVYDDKDLPLGQLRLRETGSAGGHNGVKSIITQLGTDKFPRLRVGIGAPEHAGKALVGHVLGMFTAEERTALEKRLDRAVEAINYAARFGFAQAMNIFNRTETPPAPPQAPPRTDPPAHS